MLRNRAPRNQSRKDVTEGFRQRSDLIVQCARKCVEEKGVQRTTLVDIAREADMTRELIYYYYSGKKEIIEEVLNSYVQDAVDTARLWCDSWLDQNASDETPLPYEAIVDAVASVRRFFFDAVGSRRPMFEVLEETKRSQEALAKMCAKITSELGSHQTAKRLGATFCHLSRFWLDAAFKFYLFGVIGIIECEDLNDASIADFVYATTGSVGNYCPHDVSNSNTLDVTGKDYMMVALVGNHTGN